MFAPQFFFFFAFYPEVYLSTEEAQGSIAHKPQAPTLAELDPVSVA